MDRAGQRVAQISRHMLVEGLGTAGTADGRGEPVLMAANPTAAAVATTPSGAPVDPRGVYIVGVARTAMGAFQGGLSSLTAPQLGSAAIKEALARSGVPAGDVGEVLFGNVVSANVGQSPARQAALGAGIPIHVDVTTINKVCSSGLKAITLGASLIRSGAQSIVLAGGMESMSNAPYYVPALRAGARLGDSKLVDGMIKDGLWDPYNDIHMGECAERVADEFKVGRDAMDRHALESVERAKRAAASGVAAWEIVAVEVKDRRGKVTVMDKDEAVSKMDPDKLGGLRPSFRRDASGRVTAGNSSPITDGAAAVVLASGEEVIARGLSPLALIRGAADGAVEPARFPVAPSVAAPKALRDAGLTAADVNQWEFNEAFSVVHVVNAAILGLPDESVNSLGGAVALGHPIGASGARIIITLINALRTRNGKIGVAAICNGGGGASSAVIEFVGRHA